MQKSLVLLLFSLLLLSSCGKDDDNAIINVDLSDFEAISESYPYNEIVTENTVDYFELIYSRDFENEEIVFSLGEKCQNSTNPSQCISNFDSTENQIGGFSTGCLPGYCFHYIKYQSGDEISIITNTDELRTFLGNIDSKSDAILLAMSQNYNFSTDTIEIGAVRETETGYELLMTKLVSSCSPIQTNRFLLEVTVDGSINILGEEVYSSSGGCI